MHEGVVNRAFDRLAELSAWHEERMNVHPVRVKRQSSRGRLLVVNRHEHEVNVGLCPDGVVRQAAAEDGRENGVVLFYLLDERSKRFSELLLGRPVVHTRSSFGNSGLETLHSHIERDVLLHIQTNVVTRHLSMIDISL